MVRAHKSLWVPFLAAAAAVLGGCVHDGRDDEAGPAGGSEMTTPARAERSEPTRRDPAQTESRPGEPRYRAIVAIEDEDRVAALQGPPWRVIRETPVPSGPHNVDADSTESYFAVSSPPAGEVTILNARGKPTARVSAGAGSHDVAFTPSGDRLWVGAEDASRIVKLEVPSGRVVGSRPTSGPPHDLAVSPDGRELWVTIDGASEVELRSARSGDLVARPNLGAAPHDVAVEPGGKRIWFSNWASALLTVASAVRRATLDQLAAGTEPHHFAFGAGSLWATDNGGGELLRIDQDSRRIRSATAVGPAPHHVAVAGRRVLVAVHGSGQLAIVSRRGRLLRRLELGPGPHGIAVLKR
jgi:DNA-binding beta-propeller fold protein YncE